jgi:hypothetical protein
MEVKKRDAELTKNSRNGSEKSNKIINILIEKKFQKFVFFFKYLFLCGILVLPQKEGIANLLDSQ